MPYIFVIIFHSLVKVVMTQPKKSFEKLHLRHQGQEKQLAPHALMSLNDQNNLSFGKIKASLLSERKKTK